MNFDNFAINQINQIKDVAMSIISELSPSAIDELLGGYDNDINKLLNSIYSEVAGVLNFGKTISAEKVEYMDNVFASMDVSLKKHSYNYFKTTCLPSFTQGWRNLEWGNMVQLYPWCGFLSSRGSGKSFEWCYAWILWRLYSYDRPDFYRQDNVDNKNRKETCLITNTHKLATVHVSKIVEEIETNEILRQKLHPNGKGSLGDTGIETESGSILHVRGKDSFIRGLHVGGVVCDDLPDESSIYSLEQREKLLDLFRGSITPIVEPYGYLIVDGCVHPETIVQTDCGFCKIGDFAQNEISDIRYYEDLKTPIMGKDGLEDTSHFYYNGLTETNKILIDGGYSLECSDRHPLLILTKTGNQKWIPASKLKEGDMAILRKGNGINGTEEIDESLSFLFGAMQDLRFKIINDEIFFRLISEELIKYNDKLNLGITKASQYYSIKNEELKNLLEKVNNELPEIVLTWNEKTLLYYLAGLLVVKGNQETSGLGGRCDMGNRVYIRYSKKKFLEQLQVVLLALGYASRIRREKKNGLYRLYLSRNIILHVEEEIGFKLEKFKNISYKDEHEGVPYQVKLVNKIRFRNKRTENEKTFKRFYLKEGKNTSYSKTILRNFLNTVSYKRELEGDAYKSIEQNIREDFVYRRIVEIKKSKCFTVDVVIPTTHNFLANGIVSHNTPYQEQDLYASLKKDERFMVFEYPIIFPDGKPLAPDRFTYEQIVNLRKSLGTLVFSREYMVVPISDDSTIFPYEYLIRSTFGMENVDFVNNIESYPFKMKRVVVGADFAISGNVAADFTVFSVIGQDFNGDYHLLYLWRKRGASHNEQVNQLVLLNRLFKPNEIVCEANGFQGILASLCKERGLKNIKTFITTSGNKKDLKSGLPSLSALFENGSIKIPYKHGATKDLTDHIFGEFSSIAFRSDKGTLEAISGHDDIVSSIFIGINTLRENQKRFSVSMM